MEVLFEREDFAKPLPKVPRSAPRIAPSMMKKDVGKVVAVQQSKNQPIPQRKDVFLVATFVPKFIMGVNKGVELTTSPPVQVVTTTETIQATTLSPAVMMPETLPTGEMATVPSSI